MADEAVGAVIDAEDSESSDEEDDFDLVEDEYDKIDEAEIREAQQMLGSSTVTGDESTAGEGDTLESTQSDASSGQSTMKSGSVVIKGTETKFKQSGSLISLRARSSLLSLRAGFRSKGADKMKKTQIRSSTNQSRRLKQTNSLGKLRSSMKNLLSKGRRYVSDQWQKSRGRGPCQYHERVRKSSVALDARRHRFIDGLFTPAMVRTVAAQRLCEEAITDIQRASLSLQKCQATLEEFCSDRSDCYSLF